MNYKTLQTNGVALNVAQAGPKKGPLIILLHGFPDFSYAWRTQIPELVAQGYRVWVPDQRGYNLSDKPTGVAAYSINNLARDIVGLIDSAGVEKATIIGHDWGAAVAWWLAQNHVDRINKLVVMNVPHSLVMMKHLKGNFRQMRRSWYMLFFQIPWLPEKLLAYKQARLLKRLLLGSSHEGTFSEEDLAVYQKAWLQPGAIKAMLNWYRAILQKPSKPIASPIIKVPTLLIWGVQDIALGVEMAQPSIDLCENGQLILIEQASHWVMHEEPKRVNKLIVEFLTEQH